MSRFLETICIRDGNPMHLEWHQRRVDATLRHFYSDKSAELQVLPLSEILLSCEIPNTGIYRCRILYDLNALSVEFYHYELNDIKSLRCIPAQASLEYRYKYSDRKALDALFAQRNDADDILITRGGWLTDTSTANIAFLKNNRWYTPSFPLLAGTTWKRLVSKGILIPRPIHQRDISQFEAIKIFNAMREWEQGEEIRTGSIFW